MSKSQIRILKLDKNAASHFLRPSGKSKKLETSVCHQLAILVTHLLTDGLATETKQDKKFGVFNITSETLREAYRKHASQTAPNEWKGTVLQSLVLEITSFRYNNDFLLADDGKPELTILVTYTKDQSTDGSLPHNDGLARVCFTENLTSNLQDVSRHAGYSDDGRNGEQLAKSYYSRAIACLNRNPALAI